MEYRRAYSDMTKGEATKMIKQVRKRGYKARLRKDPNGRYEIWLYGGK